MDPIPLAPAAVAIAIALAAFRRARRPASGDQSALEGRVAKLERRVADLEAVGAAGFGEPPSADPFGSVGVYLIDPGRHPFRVAKAVREITDLGLRS